MRIRKKILSLVIPLSILPSLMIGIYAYNTLITGFEEQIYLENQQLCHLAASNVEDLLDKCHDGILLISTILSTKLLSRQALEQFKNHIIGKDNFLYDV